MDGRSKALAHFSLAVALFGAAASNGEIPQTRPPIASQADTDVLQRGTINLALCNRNGIVLLADSRRSGATPFACGRRRRTYCDDSQKAFRAGSSVGMLIAGFAAARVPGTPLDSHMGAYLRGRLPRPGNLGTAESLVQHLGGSVMPYILVPLAALFDTRTADFVFIVGEAYGEYRRIVKTTLAPRPVVSRPTGATIADYRPEVSVRPCTHFNHFTAGVDREARAILDGRLAVSDRVVTNYQASPQSTRDALTSHHLMRIAKAIAREVKQLYPNVVGGPDQVLLVTRSGDVVVRRLPSRLREEPKQSKLLPSMILIGEREFTSGNAPSGESYKALHVPLSVGELRHGFGKPIPQVFVGNAFRDVTVELDNNVFTVNTFERVTFRYHGGSAYFDNRNIVRDCTIEVDGALQKFAGQLSKCRVTPFTGKEAENRIGVAAVAKKVGTGVTILPDGSMKVDVGPGESSYVEMPVR